MARSESATTPYGDGLEFWADQIERMTLRLKLHACARLIADGSFLPDRPRSTDDVAELQGRLLVELAALEDHIASRRAAGLPSALPLDRIADAFGLDPLERDILCLSLVPELEPSFRGLMSKLRRASSRDQLDPETAIELLCDSLAERIAARRCFADTAPLMRDQLIVLDDTRATKRVMNYALRPSPAMIRALLGDAAVENPLAGLCRVTAPTLTLDEVHLPGWKAEVHHICRSHAERVIAAGTEATGGDPLVLLFLGAPGTGKTMLAEALAAALPWPLMTVSTSALLKKPLDAVRNIEVLLFEASLRRAVLFFDDCEALLRRENFGFHDALKLLDGFDGIVILATNTGEPVDPAFERVVSYVARFTTPSVPLREQIWRRQLTGVPVDDDVDPARLSQRFEMAGGHIRNAVRLARQKAAMGAISGPHLVAAATRRSALTRARSGRSHGSP